MMKNISIENFLPELKRNFIKYFLIFYKLQNNFMNFNFKIFYYLLSFIQDSYMDEILRIPHCKNEYLKIPSFPNNQNLIKLYIFL